MATIINFGDIITKLTNAKRYYEVLRILRKIDSIEDSSLPVDPYGDDDGKINYRIDVSVLKDDASRLLYCLEHPIYTQYCPKSENAIVLSRYVRTHNDMFLHNYANAISHNSEPDVDIDIVRPWLILENLIWYLFNDSEMEWYVPEGWKSKKETEILTVNKLRDILDGLPDDMVIKVAAGIGPDPDDIKTFRTITTVGIVHQNGIDDSLCFGASYAGMDISKQISESSDFCFKNNTICKDVFM